MCPSSKKTSRHIVQHRAPIAISLRYIIGLQSASSFCELLDSQDDHTLRAIRAGRLSSFLTDIQIFRSRGLEQKGLAHLLGVNTNSVAYSEKDRGAPIQSNMKRLIEISELSPKAVVQYNHIFTSPFPFPDIADPLRVLKKT